ncbi:MAG TPA: hypothetical protein VE088_03740 [Gaiellaceae bacterium]|jgi:hypothetical protein|nr:hypothetical protein [Gaiellaceae bacterium]
MRRRLSVLAALSAASLSAALLAAPADAHPDPAGEFLTTQRVFVSYDAHLSSSEVKRLESVVASAVGQGFDIRVALIWRRGDLGKVPQYWRRPGAYAAFVYGENSYYFKSGRLLVVMPDGFGFAWQGHPTAAAHRILARVRLGRSAAQLADAALVGVQRLAAADGLHVTAAVASDRNNRDRVKILAGAAILLLAAGAIRRRRPGRLPVQRT